MAPLIANARMYAITPAVRDAWRDLFYWLARWSGVPLSYLEHAAPAPLEALWVRDDLAAAFMCGYPFASAMPQPVPVAAPLLSPARYHGRPAYCTDLVVRADSRFERIGDTFGRRIGWTVTHSQSGFNAVRHHLLRYRKNRSERLFSATVGPLVTPRRVIEALLEGTIDVGPLDSYVHDLLKRYEPAIAAKLRTIESTPMTPIPPLIASPATPGDVVERLRRALLSAAGDRDAASILERLLLAGFAPVDPADYQRLLAQAQEAEASGYAMPT